MMPSSQRGHVIDGSSYKIGRAGEGLYVGRSNALAFLVREESPNSPEYTSAFSVDVRFRKTRRPLVPNYILGSPVPIYIIGDEKCRLGNTYDNLLGSDNSAVPAGRVKQPPHRYIVEACATATLCL